MAGRKAIFFFEDPLEEADSQVKEILDLEEERQERKIVLIASESHCPRPVREALASTFSNIYAEGYPSWRYTEGANRDPLDYPKHLAYYRRYSDLRYYKGCDYADFIETLAQKRLAQLFATEEWPAEKIFANVQPLSGAAANNAVYNAFLRPGDTVLGLDLTHGGHLTHGSPANRSGMFFHVVPYGVNPATGRLDYEALEKLAREHRPKLIVAGASAYPWAIDWDRLRAAADEVGAILLADIAHPAGLVAAGLFPNPVGKAHVVSFTTHKTLCGPRGAALLCTDPEIAAKVNLGVFPGEQGGPHLNQIAAKAVSFALDAREEFRELMKKTVENARAMAAAFEEEGFRIVYGGTETHLFLIDLASVKYPVDLGSYLKGELASRLLDLAGIVVNKNTIPGDDNAAHPRALRFGTTWVTQRGFGKEDVAELARIIAKLLKGAHPFQYMENSGYVGRAKVDLSLLEETRARAAALLGKVEGKRGYPHFLEYPARSGREPSEGSLPSKGFTLVEEDAGVLDVWSERAHYFVQSIGTADLSRLGEWEAARTLILDKEGGLVDDPLVVRLAGKVAGWRRYVFLTSPERHEALRTWFRAVSDGYVLFDEEVHRKVEGPVIVEDLTGEGPARGGEKWTCVGLYGPEGRDALVRLGVDPPGAGRAIQWGKVLVLAPRFGEDRFLLFGPAGALEEAKRGLKGRKGDPGVRAAWRKAAGLPRYASGEKVDVGALAGGLPGLVEPSKVYFVGQDRIEVKGKPLPERKWEPPSLPLRRTPLFETHAKLTRKSNLVPFAGWEMPVVYTSIQEEHEAVRKTCGLFDVAHMGVLQVRGEHAQRFLDALTTNYVAWLRDGQVHYSYVAAPDGSILDDILVYRRAWDRYMVVVNAANAEKVLAHFQDHATGKFLVDLDFPWKRPELPVEVTNLKERSAGKEMRVDLALQGPKAPEILAAATDNPALVRELARKARFEFVEGEFVGGIHVILSRTGYTGEPGGVEFYVHPDHLKDLWDLLMEKGEPFGLKPAGLGARDSTRTEAGFPLYGHELAGPWKVTPIEAGYGVSVKFHKPFFAGRKALLENELHRTREIVRFKVPGARGKSLIRHGHPVVDGRGRYAGVVTSCCVVGEDQVGLALVQRKAAKVGAPLHFFALPASERRIPKAKRIDQLEPGDAVLLSQEGRIVERFLQV